jgi:hypothetical protein
VANDGQPNQLWINHHDGTFMGHGVSAGVALSAAGQPEASMGVDAGDVDNDGDEDLFITNWLDQMNVLYVNDGRGTFEDRRARAASARPAWRAPGSARPGIDVDSDGWLDLFVANGGVATIESQARAGDKLPLRMTPVALSQSRQTAASITSPRKRGPWLPTRTSVGCGVLRCRQRRRHRHRPGAGGRPAATARQRDVRK